MFTMAINYPKPFTFKSVCNTLGEHLALSYLKIVKQALIFKNIIQSIISKASDTVFS